MSAPIPPIGPSGSAPGVRRVGSRAIDIDEDQVESGADDGAAGLPMVIEAQPKPRPPRSKRAALAAFAAQLLGQGGQKRGLRGGAETLDKARNAYMEAEWSGPADRRLRTGRITKTDI
jgi:hypothetical protein